MSTRLIAVSKGEPVLEKIVATFHFKKRGRPRYHYQGEVLRYYTPYLVYYKTVPKRGVLGGLPEVEESASVGREERAELIRIPVRGVDAVVDYAKSLDARVEYVKRYLPRLGRSERIPVMVFPDEYRAMRHLLFSLTYATLRSPRKVERLRWIVSGLNVSIIEPFYYTALFRYRELRNRRDPAWHWKLLRIGMAFKVMYMLDR